MVLFHSCNDSFVKLIRILWNIKFASVTHSSTAVTIKSGYHLNNSNITLLIYEGSRVWGGNCTSVIILIVRVLILENESFMTAWTDFCWYDSQQQFGRPRSYCWGWSRPRRHPSWGSTDRRAERKTDTQTGRFTGWWLWRDQSFEEKLGRDECYCPVTLAEKVYSLMKTIWY